MDLPRSHRGTGWSQPLWVRVELAGQRTWPTWRETELASPLASGSGTRCLFRLRRCP